MENEKYLSIRIHRMTDKDSQRGKKRYRGIGSMIAHINRTEKMDKDYLLNPELQEENLIEYSASDLRKDIASKKQRIEKEYFNKYARAMPKNTSPYIDGLITFSETMQQDLAKFGKEEMWKATKEFLIQEFGGKNLICLSLHVDETTPHFHFISMNWNDKEKRAYSQAYEKELKANDGKSNLQDRLEQFYKLKMPDFDYSRGKHTNIKKYHSERKKQHDHLKALENKSSLLVDKVKELEGQVETLETALEEKTSQLDEAIKDLNKVLDERDDLRQERIDDMKEWLETLKEAYDEEASLTTVKKVFRAATSKNLKRLGKWVDVSEKELEKQLNKPKSKYVTIDQMP